MQDHNTIPRQEWLRSLQDDRTGSDAVYWVIGCALAVVLSALCGAMQ